MPTVKTANAPSSYESRTRALSLSLGVGVGLLL